MHTHCLVGTFAVRFFRFLFIHIYGESSVYLAGMIIDVNHGTNGLSVLPLSKERRKRGGNCFVFRGSFPFPIKFTQRSSCFVDLEVVRTVRKKQTAAGVGICAITDVWQDYNHKSIWYSLCTIRIDLMGQFQTKPVNGVPLCVTLFRNGQ